MPLLFRRQVPRWRLQQQQPLIAWLRVLLLSDNVRRFQRSSVAQLQLARTLTTTTVVVSPPVAVVTMMPWIKGSSGSQQQETLGGTWLSPTWIGAAAAAALVSSSQVQQGRSCTTPTTDCCGIAGVVGSSQKNHDARYVCDECICTMYISQTTL
jgi:hypothetical protein